jgi:hypothetical protein
MNCKVYTNIYLIVTSLLLFWPLNAQEFDNKLVFSTGFGVTKAYHNSKDKIYISYFEKLGQEAIRSHYFYDKEQLLGALSLTGDIKMTYFFHKKFGLALGINYGQLNYLLQKNNRVDVISQTEIFPYSSSFSLNSIKFQQKYTILSLPVGISTKIEIRKKTFIIDNFCSYSLLSSFRTNVMNSSSRVHNLALSFFQLSYKLGINYIFKKSRNFTFAVNPEFDLFFYNSFSNSNFNKKIILIENGYSDRMSLGSFSVKLRCYNL